jgi:hypothetical protein
MSEASSFVTANLRSTFVELGLCKQQLGAQARCLARTISAHSVYGGAVEGTKAVRQSRPQTVSVTRRNPLKLCQCGLRASPFILPQGWHSTCIDAALIVEQLFFYC